MFKRIGLLCLIAAFVTAAIPYAKADAAAPATLRLGSTGADVPDLQYRLKLLGYYTPAITTKFNISTQVALRHFQRDYGLQVDGIAGASAWRALKKYTVSKPELAKLARVVYGEARGESYTGQVAVAAVVMNRLQSPLFPKTVTGVIFEPYAFTAIADGQYWLIPDATAFKAARDAVRGWDPTGNALYYYNPVTATSDWMRNRTVMKVIGNHVFTK